MYKHPYLPQTPSEITEMLQKIGVASIDDLFYTIPMEYREKAKAEIPSFPALSESDLACQMRELSDLNASEGKYISFLGGACGRHYVPAVTNYFCQRGEFLTSYTPYQPEVSQGNLQALFEFQTYVCLLTGLDVANSGLYDGAAALVEAVLLSLRVKKRGDVVLLARSLPPGAKLALKSLNETIFGMVGGHEGQPEMTSKIVEVRWDEASGMIDQDHLASLFAAYGERVASLVVGYPNYLGVVEDLTALSVLCKKHGSLLVSHTVEALALAYYEAPGKLGADISCGDLQSFGVPISFGGPYCGFLAARTAFLRQLPGRLVGETVDVDGKRGFVLTLSTREQHIRRDKATSNVCTNNALLALAVTITLSLLGKNGLAELAQLNVRRRQLAERVLTKAGAEICYTGPRFNQVVVSFAGKQMNSREIIAKAYLSGILLGPSLGRGNSKLDNPKLDNQLLLSVTELNSEHQIQQLEEFLSRVR